MISTLTDLICRESHAPPKGAVASLVLLGAKFHDQVMAAVKPLMDEGGPGLRITAAEVMCGIARITARSSTAAWVAPALPVGTPP